MRINNKILAHLAFALVILLCVYDAVVHSDKIDSIDKKGIELVARVTSVGIAKGYNIHFVYYYNEVLYENQGNTTRFACAVGDSILIMILPEAPGGEFKLEGKMHKGKLSI